MSDPTVSWVGRPTHRPGLDNLGTQQPCVMIYSHLLPGITNVTDRAIYFGFYPWFIRAFANRFPDASATEFKHELRKADCLLTLVAQRHGSKTGDTDSGRHGGACPGNLKLAPAAQELNAGSNLLLSRFADRSDTNLDRYFKNPLGGLGQYYLGVLRDVMGVLVGDARVGIKYIEETTNPIADAFANAEEEDAFFTVLEDDQVSANDLDGLSFLCPCAMADGHRPAIQARLVDLVFTGGGEGILSTKRRNDALSLLLGYLRDQEGAATGDPVQSFLAACYSQSLDGANSWTLTDQDERVRQAWALYARNEMLSLAWLGLFKAALDCLDGLPKPIFNLSQAADWLLDQEAFAYRPSAPFDELIATESQTLPPQQASQSPLHELQLWDLLSRQPKAPVQPAVELLVKLIARHGKATGNYREVDVSVDALSGYPLNLDTLALQAVKWSGLSAERWMHSLLVEVLSAHQRVAIRKLGQSGEDTLMFRTGEGGLFVDRPLDRIPETQPRLRQTLQILRDLGLCEPLIPGRHPRLTLRGGELLHSLRA